MKQLSLRLEKNWLEKNYEQILELLLICQNRVSQNDELGLLFISLSNYISIFYTILGYGTSNDGNTARKFFAEAETVAKILGVSEPIVKRYRLLSTITLLH